MHQEAISLRKLWKQRPPGANNKIDRRRTSRGRRFCTRASTGTAESSLLCEARIEGEVLQSLEVRPRERRGVGPGPALQHELGAGAAAIAILVAAEAGRVAGKRFARSSCACSVRVRTHKPCRVAGSGLGPRDGL